jgi:hypothetical protein
MAKRIIDTSKPQKRIVLKDKPMRKVDPAKVAEALGAEIVGPAPKGDVQGNSFAYKLLNTGKVQQGKEGPTTAEPDEVKEKDGELVTKK